MTPLEIIRRKKIFRFVSAFMALNILASYLSPTAAFALTSGPAQEEFASFEPVSTSDMVDLYSGDFNYNIPIMSVPGPNGGYPINIAYHSGIGMEQEASWVGLGWNINVGAINRQMRGLPDDFSGDVITNKYSARQNVTVGVGFDVNRTVSEYLGIPRLYQNQAGVYTQIYYNTYKGLGYRISSSTTLFRHNLGFAGASVQYDSQGGVGIEPTLSWTQNGWFKRLNIGGGLTINSREGLQGYSFSLSGNIMSGGGKSSGSGIGFQGASTLTFNTAQGVPNSTLPSSNQTFAFDLNLVGVAGQRTDGNLTTDNLPGYFENFGLSFWDGFVNISSVEPVANNPSYGYLYDHNSNPAAVRDFSRDPIEYSKLTPNLPTSSTTYDIFNMTGQGVGGHFRSMQQSVRSYSSQKYEGLSRHRRINIEAGIDWDPADPLDEYHVGLGFSNGWGGTSTGVWENIGSADAEFLSDLELYDATNDPIKEYAPFKLYGEKTAVLLNDEDQLGEWDAENAVRVELGVETTEGGWLDAHFEASSMMSDGTSTYTPFDFTAGAAQLNKDQRERRATNIEYFTNQHAQLFGFTKNIGYEDAQDDNDLDNISKPYPTYAKSHHISEISVLKPDGMRYTYGLPAYNTEQTDAYFSVQAAGSTFNTTTVPVPVTNSEIDPAGTPDNFLSEQELPAYVHSWLLTSVVSADYLDLTGDGPSDDDYGYWVRFNYKKTSGDYNWRVPYADASFIVGNASDINDDKGSFSFGKKELYYIESVETKTHIAVFTTSRREDAVGADGKFATNLPAVTPPTGTITNSMYKLDQIALYSKAEYYLNITNRTLRSNPIAIQKAHFRYTYDLCPNVPNNTNANVNEFGATVPQNDPSNVNAARGKLTLKKLFFTYETSSRGEFSPYIFNYDNSNPQYDRKNMDRWGHYKNNDSYSVYPYVDFPYTEQSSPPDAGVWSLSSIDLPTGAKMQISYESDDYKYVEGKKAERMFDIIGTEESTSGSYQTSRLSTGAPMSLNDLYDNDNEFRIYIKLEHPYTSSSNHVDFFRDYLDNGKLDTIYFKVNAEIKNTPNSYYDYVSGYARVSFDEKPGIASKPDYDIVLNTSTGLYDIGYITLIGEDLQRSDNSGLKVHPFTKAGIEHLHYNRPDIATTPVPQSPNAFNQAVNFISTLGGSGVMNDMASMIAGYNTWAFIKGCSKKIKLNGWSVIRLQDPDEKFGGGDRVSQLTIEDTWSNDGNNNNEDHYSYGQKYSYKLEDGTSSGVAYEPQIGGEESALRTPRPYEYSIPVKGAQHLFIENPIMESYYPGAGVGYSRVEVKSIGPDNAIAESPNPSLPDNRLLHTSAPLSIYEFYTPKDFPVIVDETPITADASIVRPIMIPGIYTNYKKYMARSQGYSVVLNDMPGKLKSVEIRTRPTINGNSNNADGSLISRQTFIYNTEAPYSEDKVNKLSSKVQVLACSSGTVQYQTALIGQSHDIFIDMNENREYMNTRGADFNLDLQFNVSSGFPTFFFLMPLIHVSRNDVRQRTIVTNKIIHRSAILKEVITTDHESTVKSTYIAFDKETGEPLLTKISNEYEDDVYGFTYPAHWYYPAMNGSYKNFGVEISPVTSPGSFPINASTNGRINLQNHIPSSKSTTDYFTPGDKIW
ncbi:MAG: hypothetical protein L6Q81_12630, partial [Bacteroidia bacterium]|nr:hypothetical protein [Bacteroidia bacterium]